MNTPKPAGFGVFSCPVDIPPRCLYTDIVAFSEQVTLSERVAECSEFSNSHDCRYIRHCEPVTDVTGVAIRNKPLRNTEMTEDSPRSEGAAERSEAGGVTHQKMGTVWQCANRRGGS